MGTLFKESRTLPCPHCGRYILSGVTRCDHCSRDIDPELMNEGIEKETEETRKVQINFYRNALIIGIILLVCGLGNFILGFISLRPGAVNIDCISVILVILGSGQILYALNGFYKERK